MIRGSYHDQTCIRENSENLNNLDIAMITCLAIVIIGSMIVIMYSKCGKANVEGISRSLSDYNFQRLQQEQDENDQEVNITLRTPKTIQNEQFSL